MSSNWWPKTPVTQDGLEQYDRLPVGDAIFRAWMDSGQNSIWHLMCKEVVKDTMPLLARALDRYCEQLKLVRQDEIA